MSPDDTHENQLSHIPEADSSAAHQYMYSPSLHRHHHDDSGRYGDLLPVGIDKTRDGRAVHRHGQRARAPVS
jgi:hypothetical protein